MESDEPDHSLADDLLVPEGRERLGRAHQLRVDISIALSMAPLWVRRALSDRNFARSRGARLDIVERIAAAIERRFIVRWRGSDDEGENARAVEDGGPLFGGPDFCDPLRAHAPVRSRSIDSVTGSKEHIGNK
ncbi:MULTISPECIES: hypothetical protein [Sphingomonadales]|jgi:hypothetical protein|uniref:Uncharacterized protein n=1 Tax=Sphingomonas bisphenolicum TaxID=296544 RepID=A0ABM7G577_9SPHN|nr:hypothetical protein [Sphingomonas bisphenolicum]BBF70549.1 hypothetical protein SBA_ch1_27490 [Sphingomonas bisphenolicum]